MTIKSSLIGVPCIPLEPTSLMNLDFITYSGSSEHSLDSESKFEPSVATVSEIKNLLLLAS